VLLLFPSGTYLRHYTAPLPICASALPFSDSAWRPTVATAGVCSNCVPLLLLRCSRRTLAHARGSQVAAAHIGRRVKWVGSAVDEGTIHLAAPQTPHPSSLTSLLWDGCALNGPSSFRLIAARPVR
jgi:hypothetical protein